MTEPIRKFYLVFVLISLVGFNANESFAQQDCFDGISVCNSTYLQNTSFSGFGASQEVQPGVSCLGNGESNSVWYTFSVSNDGSLEFQLSPINPNDDYDYALFDLSNDSCSGISAGINSPVSCNYSADPGSTGLSPGGIGNENGSSDPNQNAAYPVLQGQNFALLISNFTSSQSGYSLEFSGSASISDNLAPEPDSISTKGLCNPRDIFLFFDERIDCSSMSGDDSEISITGPYSPTILSVNGIGCNQGTTDQLRIRLDSKINQVGTYTINISLGSDGDSYTDACGNEISNNSSISFEVDFVGPNVQVINVINASCGQDNGSAQADINFGTGPFSYNWNSSPSQNTQTASNLSPGNYKVTVTDSNGCTERATVTINNNSPINLSDVVLSNVSCFGATDGSATINPDGGQTPYSIEWQTSPIQTGNAASNLSAGNFEVSVTDNSGCTETANFQIQQPDEIGVPISSTNPDCGVSNGSATVSATGGAGGFTYQWNSTPVQNTATAANLPAGVYYVDVVDQNGCSASASVILTDNFAPNAAIENRISDCGQGSGQATAVATTGIAPYSYQWSTTPAQNTATATGLTEGDYFVTITDAAGCVQIINVKIDTISPPSVTTTPTQPSCGMADGEIEALTTNGVEPYTYSWSSSANTTNIETGLPEGSYTVTVTDSIGCIDTETIDLVQQPPISEIEVNSVCFGEETSFSFSTTSGATAWEWDFGDGTTSTDASPTHTFSTAGDFDVTLSLTGGCLPDNVMETANVFEPPTAEFVTDPAVPTTRDEIAFVYTGNGGNSFMWDLGDGTTNMDSRPTHQYAEAGTYDVFLGVVDANGCEDTITQTIEVLLEPVVYLPNAFIPEGTLENSRFRGYGIGVVSAELSVYDRWGTMVFYSNDIGEILTTGWDGTFKGKPAKQGAYAYKLKSSFYNGSEFQKLGSVILIR